MLWRRRAAPAVLVEPEVPLVDPRATLLRIAAEAVVLQDDADAVLTRIRAHAPLAETARRGGPLSRRFFFLRDALPHRCDDTDLERTRQALAVILDHHGHLVATALELSAAEWRSDILRRQVEALDGVGAPGRQLDALWADLAQ